MPQDEEPSPTTDHQTHNDQIIIVTRVGSWLGAEIALNLIRSGATVIGIGQHSHRINDLRTAMDQGLPAAWRNRFVPIVGLPTDAALCESVLRCIGEQTTEHRKLAALVVNIGAEDHPPAESTTATDPPFERWTRLQRSLVQTLPLFHAIRHLLTRNRCRVVHVAALDDIHNNLPHSVSLAAIKTAVNVMTAEIAIIEPRITSLAVHPSLLALEKALDPSSARNTADGSKVTSAHPAPATTSSTSYSQSPNRLNPAAEMIADLATNADHSMSGQFFMYSESSFPSS
ncbi:hypothetical protein GGI11_001687 [Coemansia sp. RSA 2049]|nr:hypothetical protein H4217_001490 [Coemansia sp. RSA 1939]KAJ2522638.1 hypothetical protein GGI11_001687 [Coemansia sp. RSA 2049]KAJ2615505.1 hypothetical protein EV177_001544 [Coemansia sp. RSA 1804]KAJ2694888.1 hypothetical protein GGH99_000438 [Coemansia sp. RSA 1285]